MKVIAVKQDRNIVGIINPEERNILYLDDKQGVARDMLHYVVPKGNIFYTMSRKNKKITYPEGLQSLSDEMYIREVVSMFESNGFVVDIVLFDSLPNNILCDIRNE